MISRAASRTSSEAPAPFSVPSITAFSFSRVRSDAGILSIGVLLSQRPAQYRSSLIANQARVHPNPFPSKLRTSPSKPRSLTLPIAAEARRHRECRYHSHVLKHVLTERESNEISNSHCICSITWFTKLFVCCYKR